MTFLFHVWKIEIHNRNEHLTECMRYTVISLFIRRTWAYRFRIEHVRIELKLHICIRWRYEELNKTMDIFSGCLPILSHPSNEPMKYKTKNNRFRIHTETWNVCFHRFIPKIRQTLRGFQSFIFDWFIPSTIGCLKFFFCSFHCIVSSRQRHTYHVALCRLNNWWSHTNIAFGFT